MVLFFEEKKILVIGDLHIGIEEAMNKEGLLVPRFHGKDILSQLKKMIDETKPEIILVNGDFKHEFWEVSEQEWRDALRVLDFLRKHGKVIILKGNHDTIIGPIGKKRDVEIRDHYSFDGVYICHGDKKQSDDGQENEDYQKAKLLVIGHLHPAITLVRGERRESYKCFLAGNFQDKEIIIMPSLSKVTVGTDVGLLDKVMGERVDFSDFRLFVFEDKVYDFGRFGDIRSEDDR